MPTKRLAKTRGKGKVTVPGGFYPDSTPEKPHQTLMVKGNTLSADRLSAKTLVLEGKSAMEIVDWSAPQVAAYLSNVARSVTAPHWARIDAAKFILLQHLNHLKASGVLDESGRRIVSYKTLIILANQFISGKTTPDSQSQEELESSILPLENETQAFKEGGLGTEP